MQIHAAATHLQAELVPSVDQSSSLQNQTEHYSQGKDHYQAVLEGLKDLWKTQQYFHPCSFEVGAAACPQREYGQRKPGIRK